MGFKSKSKETSQSNICKPFKVGGLIFDSEYDYQLFKDIDRNITQTVKSVKDGSIELKDVFADIKKINVTEIYDEAREEMDGLFSHATGLLCYGGTRFHTDYQVGCSFFRKVNVITYSDCDSD